MSNAPILSLLIPESPLRVEEASRCLLPSLGTVMSLVRSLGAEAALDRPRSPTSLRYSHRPSSARKPFRRALAPQLAIEAVARRYLLEAEARAWVVAHVPADTPRMSIAGWLRCGATKKTQRGRISAQDVAQCFSSDLQAPDQRTFLLLKVGCPQLFL